MAVAPYQEFARTELGFEFKDIQLLITALTHRSYVNEHKKSVSEHNERLEFLGDAVLELAVTDFLYNNYREPEGTLTSWRAALVRTESIGAAGDKLGYEPLLRMSRGEKHGSDRARQQILANAFEAVIGAIYLERGYADAEKFIKKHITSKLEAILEEGSWRDPKSHLQEVSQRIDGATPQYKVLEEVGPDHDKIFTLGVYVGRKLMGKGSGHSKQIAQQDAARAALLRYKADTDATD
ncbi:MAG TPA: ribonuclease III [Candidatus Saccharibacteria bacterium]|nr:ribonuclease III [Candidatus Saccharibacteria bacterium]HRK94441.1 ribonuclease III [Candidatus Saccharibacteria bacterium]